MCAQLLRFSNGLTNQFGVSTVPLSECGGSEFRFGLGVLGVSLFAQSATPAGCCCLMAVVCCLMSVVVVDLYLPKAKNTR